MRIAVTGSSGLIGSRLVGALTNDGHDVLRLVRRTPQGPREVQWDPAGGKLDPAALDGVDAAVNLAGPGIGDKRWTEEYKHHIQQVRIDATTLLATTLARLDAPPSVLLSASAIGVYGDRGDEMLDERSSAGAGFLAETARLWEAATKPAVDGGIRVATLRTGIVLAASGGALKQQLLLYRLGLGGPLGSGRQYQSWITLQDEVDAIRFLLTADVAGPVNLTAPNPVRQKDFAKALGHALHRPAVVPAPAFALRIVLGEFASEGVVAGQQVLPKVLQDNDFTFSARTIDEGITAALAS